MHYAKIKKSPLYIIQQTGTEVRYSSATSLGQIARRICDIAATNRATDLRLRLRPSDIIIIIPVFTVHVKGACVRTSPAQRLSLKWRNGEGLKPRLEQTGTWSSALLTHPPPPVEGRGGERERGRGGRKESKGVEERGKM